MNLPQSKGRIGQLPRRTFREQIVEVLRTSIIDGELAPGVQIVESDMARIFGVSRGPLREALGDLIKEGLLVTIPYTGTHVVDLSLDEMNEIFSLRTELEIFAFRQVWDKRDQTYFDELNARHERLLASIAEGDDHTSILEELSLHSHVYEACGHSLLLNMWNGLRGKLQLYWAAHHRAHGRRGPKAEGHMRYVELAQGPDIEPMIEEIRDHMVRGFSTTEAFLRNREAQKEPRPR